MNGLGLSAEAIEARRKYVQAGDAARIMSGEWRAVWREKMGLDAGPDLDDVLPVWLGSMTEPLNLAWCEKVTGREINYYSENPLMRRIWLALHGGHGADPVGCYANMSAQELQVSESYPWMAANLDGMTTTPQGEPCVIDAKHLGQAYEQEILRYTAAMTHQATVMGTDWWALSCLIGNRKHEVIYQEVDPIYQAQLISATREFWNFVEAGIQPEDRTEPKPPPKPQPKLRQIILDTMLAIGAAELVGRVHPAGPHLRRDQGRLRPARDYPRGDQSAGARGCRVGAARTRQVSPRRPRPIDRPR